MQSINGTTAENPTHDSFHSVTHEQAPQCARMFMRAFFNDPMLEYMYPEEELRRKRGHIPFEFTINMIISYGTCIATSPAMEGALLFTLSDSPFFSFLSQLRHCIISYFFAMGLSPGIRGIKYDNITRNMHGRLMKKRHLYLSALAVDSHLQKRGLSRPLMVFLIEKAAMMDLPIYLETTYRGNIDYYRQFGFSVLDEHRITDDGFYVWPMLLSADRHITAGR